MTAASQFSNLFQTEFGVVRRRPHGMEIQFDDHTLRLDEDELPSFRDSVAGLASDAWRYERPCRWQLRIQTAPDQPVVVLCSGDVYRLKSLLDGAVAMCELEGILSGAQIASAADARESVAE